MDQAAYPVPPSLNYAQLRGSSSLFERKADHAFAASNICERIYIMFVVARYFCSDQTLSVHLITYPHICCLGYLHVGLRLALILSRIAWCRLLNIFLPCGSTTFAGQETAEIIKRQEQETRADK